MRNNIKIVYMGTTEFSGKILEFLIQSGVNIAGVVSQPDKQVGRKNKLENTPVKEVALKYNIDVFQPLKIKEDYKFIEDKEHAPKPILIVNGYCDTPLAERVEDVFPNQMLKYCEARGHVLVTTTQLLCLYVEIKKNPNCTEERITELLSCVGKYQRYLDYDNYIKLVQNEENEDNE